MICESISDFDKALGANVRLLGLDVGTKTVGVAVSDALHRVASPLTTIKRTKFTRDVTDLKRIIAEEEIGGIVVGLPLEMDGSEGPACQRTRQFAKNLLEHMDLPLVFWDERLSTAAVERFMVDEADMSRKRRAEKVDQAAAAYILQGALDAMTRA